MRIAALTLAAGLTLLAHSQASAHAKRPDAPPDSFGREPAAWLAPDPPGDDSWHLLIGEARSDTLADACGSILSAAEEALENDDWVIAPYDHSRLAFVTGWKPIHNVLFRLFAGGSVARCFVSVTPLTTGHAAVTFQGGIASRRDLSHSPVRPLADRAYRKAVAVWIRDVHEGLARRRSTHRAKPGAP